MGTTRKTNRFMELEGLRAVAAIVVVLYHATLMFYPGYFYGVGTVWAPVQNAWFENYLYNNPIAGLFSGAFSVGIFFVLSGFVLTIGFFIKKNSDGIKRLAAKRYLRLMLPALAAILVAWLVIKIGWSRNMAAVVSITHSGWLNHIWHFVPQLEDALRQGTIGIFTNKVDVYYDPVLWTIYTEFIGSFVVFGAALLFSDSKYRWLVYTVLVIVFIKTWLVGFITGMVLADLYANKQIVFQKLHNKYTYGLLLIGVVFGGYPNGAVISPLYQHLHVPGLLSEQQISFFISMGATLVVLAVLSLPRLGRFFAHPRISGLGKYTYSLYLIHMPVLFSACATVFVIAFPIGFHKASVIALLVTAAMLVPIVYMFEKYIDAPAIRFSGYVASIYLGNEEVPVILQKSIRTVRRRLRRFARKLRWRPDTETLGEELAE